MQNLAIALAEEALFRKMAHHSFEQSLSVAAATALSIAYFAGNCAAPLIVAGAAPRAVLLEVAEAALSGLLPTVTPESDASLLEREDIDVSP